ncbi:retinitis pigmentosa 1-like 1 protein [Diretmus argenteus]
MHSAQEGQWDPQPPCKHASPFPPPAPSRLTHVTAPAKRITFYKSGDSQFGGVKMAIQKRSFKCFDALLDDLSQKVPLPFGVRTVTTPRGLHNIKDLEQLQDGGCYLCSDRRQVKPINMELASKRPAIWQHHSRRPQRPEAPSAAPPGHVPYRQRRILLVKNSEPGMRRSVVLSRRLTRSLKAFLDKVSEVMQFHVRKLYTMEGHKIDSVQSVVTCAGVLVCVGRELFNPLLVDFLRKSSDEKLPGLGSKCPGQGSRTPGNRARSPAQAARSPPHGGRSRGSECSEGHESKKNIKFGLETKKSIIHPRSDSSNRSTRFSSSSDKSYANGLSTCFHSQPRPAIMNDDIEKRVLVNKDGSLSVEMRVRFRIQNGETLQWSTQIKKDPSLTNDCCPLSQDESCYLQQGQSESCSDPDSTSFDPERVMEENHCPCCYQRPEQHYDFWENPAHRHKQPTAPPPHTSRQTNVTVRHNHSSSSSSSCHSQRVVRQRAMLSNCRGVSGSDHGQVVEEMCVTEEVQRRVEVEQDGDTHVEVCRVSRCCSRSEVTATESNLQPHSSKSTEDERREGGASDCKRFHDEPIMSEGEERPISAISSSSHVLQVLQEDQGEEDDLPPSTSQCCHSPSSQTRLTPQPPMERVTSSRSKTSQASYRSTKIRTPNSEEEGAADDEDEELKERVVSGLSGASSACPHCGGCKASATSDHETRKSSSRASQGSHHSHPATAKPASPLSHQDNGNISEDEQAASGADEEVGEESSPSSISSKTGSTLKAKTACDEELGSPNSALSPNKARSPQSTSPRPSNSAKSPAPSLRTPPQLVPGPGDGETRGPSALSVQSTSSAKSNRSKCCCRASSALQKAKKQEEEDKEKEENEEEKEAASIRSSTSKRSRKESQSTEQLLSHASSGSVSLGLPEDQEQETPDTDSESKSNMSSHTQSKSRAKTGSDISAGTRSLVKSTVSQKSNCNGTLSPNLKPVNIPTIATSGGDEDSAASVISEKSNYSVKSCRSYKPSCNGAGNIRETVSVKSTGNHLDAPGNRTSSALSSSSAKVRSKSSAKASPKHAHAGDSANQEVENQPTSRPGSQAKGKDDVAVITEKATSVCSKSPGCLRPESAASAHSDAVSKHSVRSVTPKESSSPCPSRNSKPCTKETSSESALSHSLSAADLLRETMAAACPVSRQSKDSAASNVRSAKSGRCRSRNQKEQEEEQELTPAFLPNSSPNEVVSDWLRSIPGNSCMVTLEDELKEGEENEKEVEEEPREKATKGEENPEDVQVEQKETVVKVEIEEEKEEKEEHAEGDAVEEEEKSDAVPPGSEGPVCQPTTLLLSESLPRNCHSSVAVMKVLLSPNQGCQRCHSLPEVSPVYGRRLSTSAKGLLDCLAQLQLNEPSSSPVQKDHSECYGEIMAILQSLWLTEPTVIEDKDACKDQVTPPRSSSGVDMSSGSDGSGKGRGTPPKPAASIHEEEGAPGDAGEGEEVHAEPGEEETAVEVKSDPTLPETDVIRDELSPAAEEPQHGEVLPRLDSPKAMETPSSSANDSSKSPTDNSRETPEDSSSGSPPTVVQASLTKRLSQDPDPAWVLQLLKKLEKEFMNHYTNTMAEFKVRWDLDDSVILDTMISELREEVSRRIQSSIDTELKKIKGRAGRSPRPPKGNLSRESTMTERRRRMLKVMKNQSVKTGDSLSDGETGEFSDQRSDDEYCPCDACVRRKMAARPPRMPPAAAPAPMMMEFDLLKILQMKKDPGSKPAAAPQPAERRGDNGDIGEEERNLEVVQEEEEEGDGEEEAETKEDLKPDVVLEETIPEEDEEKETGREQEEGDMAERETEDRVEEQAAEKETEEKEEDEGEAENHEGGEVQEEGETGGKDAEEEALENGQEEEEEEVECHAARDEEKSDKTVEGEKGEMEEEEEAEDTREEVGKEEEESDKATSKGETGGEGEGEEEEEVGTGVEDEVQEFVASEGETTGRESEEEEASGETEDAAKSTANEEESTPVEDYVEGNAGASVDAEDEDDGDDGPGEDDSDQYKKEGEEQASEEETDSPQVQDGTPAVTEGEEADAEDSDTVSSKRPSDTSVDEPGCERAGTTADKDEKGGGVVEDIVEEFKPEEEEEEGDEVRRNKGEETVLPHQYTRTSVESQSGSMESMEDMEDVSPPHPETHVEVQETVPKMAAVVP